MITLTLLNHTRPDNVRHLVSRYLENLQIGEIIVVSSSPGKMAQENWPMLTGGRVKTVDVAPNMGMYFRWAASLIAKNQTVIAVDDDLWLPPSTIEGLTKAVDATPSRLHGLFGRVPTADNKYALCRDTDETQVPIVCGRVTAFDKKLLPRFFDAVCCPEWSELYQRAPLDGTRWSNIEDIIFSYAVLAPFPRMAELNHVHVLPRIELGAPDAISARANHYEYRTEAMRFCQHFFGV